MATEEHGSKSFALAQMIEIEQFNPKKAAIFKIRMRFTNYAV